MSEDAGEIEPLPQELLNYIQTLLYCGWIFADFSYDHIGRVFIINADRPGDFIRLYIRYKQDGGLIRADLSTAGPRDDIDVRKDLLSVILKDDLELDEMLRG